MHVPQAASTDAAAEKPVVGIVGLGGVGLGAARHLLAGGWPVIGYRRGRSDDFQRLGGRRAGSAREVAELADVVLFALPSPEALDDAVLGEAGVIHATARAAVAIDLGTFPLEVKERARDALVGRGIALLDCPLGGAPPPGAPGRMALALPSGNRGAYERCAEILESFAAKVVYVGGFGAGSKLKFLCNLLVAEHTIATAEAVALGVRAGLEGHVLVEVVGQSPASSWIWEHRAALMVAGDYRPRGSVDMLRKDLAVITEFAASMGCHLPFLEAAARRFDEAAARGHGSEDIAAVFALLADEIDPPAAEEDARDP